MDAAPYGILVGLVLLIINELWWEPRCERRRIERHLRALMFLSSRPVQRRPRSLVGAGCSPASAPTGTTTTRGDWS